MPNRDVIVIGGSAGSARVLREVVPALPVDLAASVFVVVHMSRAGVPEFRAQLAGASALPIAEAVDGQPIEAGRITFAPPDRHLLIIDGSVRLGRGPFENMARPAVDALFRSAALAYGSRVIAVVLSGLLDDGAAGLFAVKRRGGLALVQHPLDAEADAMPRAALEAVAADHVVKADDLARTLAALSRDSAPASPPPDPGLQLEVSIAAGGPLGSGRLRELAEPSVLTCPECHGVLSEVKAEGPLRFRCQTGHAFTADSALQAQQPAVDEAVVVALRVMEERLNLVSRMAQESRHQGREAIAELHDARVAEYERYVDVLRQAAARSLGAPA